MVSETKCDDQLAIESIGGRAVLYFIGRVSKSAIVNTVMPHDAYTMATLWLLCHWPLTRLISLN